MASFLPNLGLRLASEKAMPIQPASLAYSRDTHNSPPNSFVSPGYRTTSYLIVSKLSSPRVIDLRSCTGHFGLVVGLNDGMVEGVNDGLNDGEPEGAMDGCIDKLGAEEASADGEVVGNDVGGDIIDDLLGRIEGLFLGD